MEEAMTILPFAGEPHTDSSYPYLRPTVYILPIPATHFALIGIKVSPHHSHRPSPLAAANACHTTK